MGRMMIVVAAMTWGACSAPQHPASAGGAPGPAATESMVVEVTSEKPVAQLREDLPKAAAAHSFGVLAVHDLPAKMRAKGVEFDGEALVFEVCNPRLAREVLSKAPQATSLLPCRISVTRGADGKTRIATIRPTRLIGALGTPDLEPVVAQVERDLVAIMNAAR